MKKSTRLILEKLLWVAGLLYTLLFLVCCATPFFDPEHLSLLTYATILFPFCFFGYLLWLLVVFIFFRKRFWIFLLLLLFSWKNASAVFSLHTKKEFVSARDPKKIRLLSWNVNGWLYGPINDTVIRNKQKAMIAFIKNSNADVLCFQDYVEAAWADGNVNIAYITKVLGYPYHYFSDDCQNYGTAIFSRLPIIDSLHVRYNRKTKYPESLAYADIAFQGDTLRFFNTHLYSMFLHSDSLNRHRVGSLEFIHEDTAQLFRTDRLDRLHLYNRLHAKQAQLIKEELNKSRRPYIFCADLNSVPSGYVYNHIREGLRDAFLDRGYGLGGTYRSYTFSLRIDVVLMSKELHATQYYSPRPELSDHYPIITDLELRK